MRGEGDARRYDDGDGPQFGPGPYRLAVREAGAAVLDDGVVQAAQPRLEFLEEVLVEGPEGMCPEGSRTRRLCPARRLRAAACGT